MKHHWGWSSSGTQAGVLINPTQTPCQAWDASMPPGAPTPDLIIRKKVCRTRNTVSDKSAEKEGGWRRGHVQFCFHVDHRRPQGTPPRPAVWLGADARAGIGSRGRVEATIGWDARGGEGRRCKSGGKSRSVSGGMPRARWSKGTEGAWGSR